MQRLAPVDPDRNPNGHTEEEILAALQGASGSRRFTFRYELLDSANRPIRELDNVLACTVSQNWLADIKRTATFRLRDSGGINYALDRIKPYVRLHLPPYGERDWVEWPQGVFLLSSPKRHVDASGLVTREVAAYDQLQVSADDKVVSRYTALPGDNYIQKVGSLLGLFTMDGLPPDPRNRPGAREWEPGTPKLRIINDLLQAINYESLSYDEDGRRVIRPYVSPDQRAEEYTYADGSASMMVPEADHELDLFAVPNKWVLYVSSPDGPPLRSVYTNTNPASPTSTVRRGRTIVDYRQEWDVADQATLDAKVARLAFEASQVYEAIEFETGLMPIHSGADVYRIRYGALAIDAKYVEHSWSMELRAGARMRHRARRVVTV
ncbi:MAG TPA: hypothetical protein VFU47_12950 [Armatimonadota bacterium]|nr:hypothetical protein [Armatimonadota bacterium]